jgi:NitT/TauT family transport system ATP-binding protein
VVLDHVRMIFPGSHGNVVAIEDLSETVHVGEVLSIVGPSGCGKSTLLRLIAGLRKPSSGSITITQSQKDRPESAMVFQDHALFPWLTIEKNVAFGLRNHGRSKADSLERAHEELDRLGLKDFAKFHPHQLSGGMKQRVGIARALAYQANVLLMDEPLGALDAQTRMALQEEFRQLIHDQGASCIYVTHAIDEAVFLSDRIVVMSSRPGRIVEVIDVPFRGMASEEVRTDTRFGELHNHIWNLLRADVAAAIMAGEDRQ